MQRLFSTCTNCIKNTYDPLSEEPPRSQPEDFIALIKNATTKDELNGYEKEIEDIEISEAEKTPGYENRKDNFPEWQKKWWAIRDKWQSARLLIRDEREKKFPSHKTNPRRDYGPPYDNEKPENYSRFYGGKKITSRNIKSKKSKRTKRTKGNKKSKRTMKRLKYF